MKQRVENRQAAHQQQAAPFEQAAIALNRFLIHTIGVNWHDFIGVVGFIVAHYLPL